ncbi:hypothetical protein [Aliarcobacter cryaerophilus]|uniref:hypothetical protein n=1 Tax=Aliarcobacter cryaerophilus TaxID=28198 RepID=UPI003DA57CD4
MEKDFTDNLPKRIYSYIKTKLNYLFNEHSFLIILIGFTMTVYDITNTEKASVKYEINKKVKNDFKEIYSIVVTNNGDINLKYIDFDDKSIWGIEVVNGKIINKNFEINSESVYLKNQLQVTLKNNNKIEFSKLFFDSNTSFSFDLEVLPLDNKKIEFKSIGKISGLESIEINPIIFSEIIIQIFNFIFTFVSYIVILIFIALSPYLIREIIINIYYAYFIERQAKKVFNNNKTNFNNFEDINLFLFLFTFFPKDLELIKQIIKEEKDILDYHKFKLYNEGSKHKKYYDIDEAEHHIKKGCGNNDEIMIYLIYNLYKQMKNYFHFSENILTINNKDNIINYIDIIIKNKKENDSRDVNSYVFIMD